MLLIDCVICYLEQIPHVFVLPKIKDRFIPFFLRANIYSAPVILGLRSRASHKGARIKIDTNSQGDGTEARPNSAVSARLTRSNMLGE